MTLLFHMKYFHKMCHFIAVYASIGRKTLFFLFSLFFFSIQGASDFVLCCLPGLVQCTERCDVVPVTTRMIFPYMLEIESMFNWENQHSLQNDL